MPKNRSMRQRKDTSRIKNSEILTVRSTSVHKSNLPSPTNQINLVQNAYRNADTSPRSQYMIQSHSNKDIKTDLKKVSTIKSRHTSLPNNRATRYNNNKTFFKGANEYFLGA